MKWKRLVCTALSGLMLCSAVLAADSPATVPAPNGGADKPTYEVKQTLSVPVAVYGKAVTVEGQSISLENSDEADIYNKITLNITDQTMILDAVTGSAKTLADLQQGENLSAYVSPVMTGSAPLQSAAILVLCNIPADFGVPTYAEVQQVTGGSGGSIDVLVSGNVVLHIGSEIQILAPAAAKRTPTLSDVKPGVMLLSWYRMVAMTVPAQATPNKIMVLPSNYAGYAAMSDKEISLNGTKVSATPYVESGKLMVPLRAVAEALGCTVVWDAKAPNAVTVRGEGKTLYTISVGAAEPEKQTALTVPAVAKNCTTYLCADDLLRLHNLKLVPGEGK